MSETAKRLQDTWMRSFPHYCEPITFGELKKNDLFITMPVPGDCEGHGGLRGIHHIFMKIDDLPTERSYNETHGVAIKKSNGTIHHFPHSMPVVLIE